MRNATCHPEWNPILPVKNDEVAEQLRDCYIDGYAALSMLGLNVLYMIGCDSMPECTYLDLLNMLLLIMSCTRDWSKFDKLPMGFMTCFSRQG